MVSCSFQIIDVLQLQVVNIGILDIKLGLLCDFHMKMVTELIRVIGYGRNSTLQFQEFNSVICKLRRTRI